MRLSRRQLILFACVLFLASLAPARSELPSAQSADLGGLTPGDRTELDTFARKAALAKKLGATHVPITDGLPAARWQLEPAGDPYPAWYIERPDFLKLFPPAELQPFVDLAYARRLDAILGERCAILRRLGLKAHWGSNIPQVLPEGFFQAHPQLRGPRVDQPNRSRVARFAPCVDRPETLRLYAEAMKGLLARCPEIESFSFLTQDSGSGFCWVPSLYPGLNGNSDCRDRPVSERIASFLVSLKDAASATGHEVEINLNPISPRQWMVPSLSPEQLEGLVHHLPRGVAVMGREGPDGRPFSSLGSSDAYAHGSFYPVVGIVSPDLRWLHNGREGLPPPAPAGPIRRLISLRPGEDVLAFGADLQAATAESAGQNVADRLTALRKFAAAKVGEGQADDLLEIWLQLDDAERRLEALNFGDMLQFGHVLNRWINRPMVPFPEELNPTATAYYRKFLFQAKGEEQAADLADIQAMRMYEGYGARLLFQRVIETTVPDLERALKRIERLRAAAPDEAAGNADDLLQRRLKVVLCLLHSADHMVAYQAQLDRVKGLGLKPDPNPPLGAENNWDRADLMRLAREEIDNTAQLIELFRNSPGPLLDLASTPDEETIMRLGPNLVAQLQTKIDLMNQHWKDYDRLSTAPNP